LVVELVAFERAADGAVDAGIEDLALLVVVGEEAVFPPVHGFELDARCDHPAFGEEVVKRGGGELRAWRAGVVEGVGPDGEDAQAFARSDP